MSECCGCGKVVDVAGMQAKQRKVLVIVLLINLATFVMMAVAAWHSHSSSLLSGSLDNLGDALTYAVSLAVVGLGPDGSAAYGFHVLGAADWRWTDAELAAGWPAGGTALHVGSISSWTAPG